MSPNLVRWSGPVDMLGGVLGIFLTPILSYLWATYSDLYGSFGRAYHFGRRWTLGWGAAPASGFLPGGFEEVRVGAERLLDHLLESLLLGC